MDWQEYQEAVSEMYEQVEGCGTVLRNITLPDLVTGQPRQVDTWIETSIKGHKLTILVDAKFHKNKIDVKVVEEVESLARAVGANKAVIVCSNGWTEPAWKRASFAGIDLRLQTIEEVVEFLHPDKWKFCPVCEHDCIIMDHEGAIEIDGLWLWWLAGQCRQCRAGIAWCQDCGDKVVVEIDEVYECYCGHQWKVMQDGMCLRVCGTDRFIPI